MLVNGQRVQIISIGGLFIVRATQEEPENSVLPSFGNLQCLAPPEARATAAPPKEDRAS